MKKKISFLTGTRADYGKIKSLIKEVYKSKKFQVHIVATGIHLSQEHGYTYKEIVKDFPKIKIYKFNNIISNKESMDLVLSNTITGINKIFKQIKPDLIVIHGDRVEALATSIVGNLNNILVSHVEGGEISGTVDESMRHATSKMSHIHFVSNSHAKKILCQMGELKENIYVIGSPEVDIMLGKKLPDISKVKKKYKINFIFYSIICLHPDVNENINTTLKNVKTLLYAAKKSKEKFVLIYPNNDKFSEIIMKEVIKLKHDNQFRVIASMRFEYYLTLLKYAKFIIGNSSSGVREAPVYGTKTINLGNRQNNRTNNKKIINLNFNSKKIVKVIKNSKNNKLKKSITFGDGKSNKKFIKIMLSSSIWKTSKQKAFKII